MLSLVTSRLTSSGSGGCVHNTEKMDGSFFVMVFFLVVMATLILESENVERNPGPVGESNSLHFSVLINLRKRFRHCPTLSPSKFLLHLSQVFDCGITYLRMLQS